MDPVPTLTLALAGDTMLGRGVADRLDTVSPTELFADEVVEVTRGADLFVCNLECAISTRGAPWPDPRKPFFFRAPPVATEILVHLGVDCVTLANNHALDFGAEALLDTFDHLERAGIAWVGAGENESAARAPVRLQQDSTSVGIVGVTDHPAAFAATSTSPGVAYADLRTSTPAWLTEAISRLGTDIVLVTPHWGPNMVAEPVDHVRRAAPELVAAGASLVAGHSAHVFHGVADRVLYDLGDFIDDYAIDPFHRNDLGLLFLVTFLGGLPVRVEALPLALDRCYTRPARPGEREIIVSRFRQRCVALGTEVTERGDRLVIEWDRSPT